MTVFLNIQNDSKNINVWFSFILDLINLDLINHVFRRKIYEPFSNQNQSKNKTEIKKEVVKLGYSENFAESFEIMPRQRIT